MNVVCRSVEGVDYPAEIISLDLMHRFLGQEFVIGKTFPDGTENKCFRFSIDSSDEIEGLLYRDVAKRKSSSVVPNQFTCSLSGFNGNSKKLFKLVVRHQTGLRELN